MVGVEPAILQQGAGVPGHCLPLYRVELTSLMGVVQISRNGKGRHPEPALNPSQGWHEAGCSGVFRRMAIRPRAVGSMRNTKSDWQARLSRQRPHSDEGPPMTYLLVLLVSFSLTWPDAEAKRKKATTTRDR